MDRCAVFIDAGHLLAEGGKLCCGNSARKNIQCDYTRLVDALARFATSHCGLSILRLYWYDAAPDAIPTQEQLDIAELANVKLRLGRLVGGRQKGVDSLIVRDLMTLARERAVATIFLLGGDEDLREGVVAAQEMGVLVVVVGIPTVGTANQARSLIRESDEHIVLETEFLAPFFSLKDAASQIVLPLPSLPAGESARLTGQSFASEWAQRATPEEIRRLLDQAPILPNQLDTQLLLAAETTLGSLRERKGLRNDLRAGFWNTLQSLSTTPTT
ncbi:MAG TPA: NYN domain-containing protein [Thermoanaerobaculia bacterium]|nr:NYN domain-containing protein [Thermoanaerobaculia bacterium]